MALGRTLELTLDGADDPLTVTYTAVNMRQYEATFDCSVLVEQVSLTQLTWLGWHAAHKAGLTTLTWAEFDAACTSVRTVSEGAVTRPTRKARGGGSSAA